MTRNPQCENLNVGPCLLRQGKYEEAAKLLSESVDAAPSGPDEVGHGDLAYIKYFLALARFRLGHHVQAQRLLAEANDHATKAGDLQWQWRVRVDLDMLRKEVEAALPQ